MYWVIKDVKRNVDAEGFKNDTFAVCVYLQEAISFISIENHFISFLCLQNLEA